jgi:hypothetical protein
MTDIDELLAAAADDTDRPLRYSVDDIVEQGRRSVRQRRIAAVSTAVLTTAVIAGGVAGWAASRSDSVGPVGPPNGQTITVDGKTGRIVDNETGKTVAPPPPVSPLSDAEALERCKQYDHEQVQFLKEHRANAYDKAGPVNGQWKVVLKTGDQNLLDAYFLAPDKSIVATCAMDKPERPTTNGRISTTEVMPYDETKLPQAESQGIRAPSNVTRVLVDIAGETSPREARMGDEGFYTIGHARSGDENWEITRIRGYDATGTKVFEQNRVSPLSDKPTTNFNKVRVADFTAWPTGGGWPDDRIYPAPPKIPSKELMGRLTAKEATTVLVDLDGGKTQRLTLDDFQAGRFDVLIEGYRQRFAPFRIRGLNQDGTAVYDELADPSKVLR